MKLLIEFKKNEHTGRADIVLPDGIWRGTSMPWDEAEEYAAAMAPQDGLREALAPDVTIDFPAPLNAWQIECHRGIWYISRKGTFNLGLDSDKAWTPYLAEDLAALAAIPAAQHEAMAPAGVQMPPPVLDWVRQFPNQTIHIHVTPEGLVSLWTYNPNDLLSALNPETILEGK